MFFNITPQADTQLSVPPAYRRSMEISSSFEKQIESFWSLTIFFPFRRCSRWITFQKRRNLRANRRTDKGDGRKVHQYLTVKSRLIVWLFSESFKRSKMALNGTLEKEFWFLSSEADEKGLGLSREEENIDVNTDSEDHFTNLDKRYSVL